MVGLHDRGRIEPGARADLVLVAYDQHWPQARAVWRSPAATRAPSAAHP
jgi:alpha-D-ribose 1-methylphosphonate 5-triphosphate diphosphatase PhnM